MNKPPQHRRIEAEIYISADSWEDLEGMIGAIGKEINTTKIADESLCWTNSTANATAELCIKREILHAND